jgi:hypothetical protein
MPECKRKKNGWLNSTNILKFLKELKYDVCMFMQENRYFFVTKDPFSHIEMCEFRGTVLPSKLSSTLICQRTTTFHSCAE